MTSRFSRRTLLLSLGATMASGKALAQKSDSMVGDPLTLGLTGVSFPVVRGLVLVNYVFGVLKIQVADSGSTFALREHSFLLRDAIIRIASRSPIPAGPTPASFDRVAVTSVVLRAVQAVRPNTRVTRVTLEEAAFMRT
jgi:hypothetical protein